MKHISFLKRNLLLAFGAFAMLATSCIKEDLEACKNYKLTLQVLNTRGDDVTLLGDVRDATLFIFDENGGLLETRKLDKNFITSRQEIELKNYQSGQKLHMVAWGNLGDQTRQNINNPREMDDLKLSLKSTDGVALSPDSLYYGNKSVMTMDGGVSANDTITVIMKTGVVTIKTEGYAAWGQKYLKSSDAVDFSVNNTLDSYDYAGKQMGDSVYYEPESTQDDAMAEWLSKGVIDDVRTGGQQNMFAGEKLGCTLYVNGQPKVTVYEGTTTENGVEKTVPFAIPEGGRLDIRILFGEDGTISAKIRITPWGVVDDKIEF